MAVEADRMPVHAAPAISPAASATANRSTTRSPWSPHRSDQTTASAIHGGLRDPASNTEQPDADFWRHQPHQTPGEHFLQHPSIERPILGRAQLHHPTGMVDVPPAIAAARGNRSAQGIPQGAAL